MTTRIYIVDDMLPQEDWPEEHPPKVRKLIQTLEALERYRLVKMCWSTGIILVTKAQRIDDGNALKPLGDERSS